LCTAAYFGGALGVILVAVLGVFLTATAQQINAAEEHRCR